MKAESQVFPKSLEYFNPKSFRGLSFNELGLWEHMTFLALERGDWIVQITVASLEEQLAPRGVANASLKRHLKELKRRRLVRQLKRSTLGGNSYLVSPELLVGAFKKKFAHYREAAALSPALKGRAHG